MKKIAILAVLIMVMSILLTSCGSFVCDLCGEEKDGGSHDAEILGEELTICDECYEEIDEAKGAFGV